MDPETTDTFDADMTALTAQVKAMSAPERAARRSDVVATVARLTSYERRTRAQQAELDAAHMELVVIDGASAADDVDRERRRADLVTAAASPGNVEGVTASRRPATRAAAFGGLDRRDTLAGMEQSEVLRRADAALEVLRARGVPDEGLDRLAGLVAAPDPDEWGDLYPRAVAERNHAAAQTVALSDPAYLAAFEKVIRSPLNFALDLTDEERYAMARTRSFTRDLAGDQRDWSSGGLMGDVSARAAMSLTAANGGYMVPFTLDPSIILTNVGAANPWRAWGNVKQTTTNDWNGVTSAGVNAAWLAEGVEVTDNSPTVGQMKITPAKAAAWVYGSYEVLDDSDFAQQLPMLLGDAKNRLEEAAFATGTGSGQPFGAITRATVTALGGGTITQASVYSLHQALAARFRQGRPGWFGNVTALDLLRQTPVFTGSQQPILQANTMAPFGEPAYESTTVDGVISTGGHKVLLYGDGTQYLIVDRVGMSVVYDPLVKSTNFRPTGQAGWFGFWRVGADAANTAALRVLSLT